MQVCDGNYCNFPVVNLTTNTFCYMGEEHLNLNAMAWGACTLKKMTVLAEQLAVQGQKVAFELKKVIFSVTLLLLHSVIMRLLP
jgi:hypothetical protein